CLNEGGQEQAEAQGEDGVIHRSCLPGKEALKVSHFPGVVVSSNDMPMSASVLRMTQPRKYGLSNAYPVGAPSAFTNRRSSTSVVTALVTEPLAGRANSVRVCSVVNPDRAAATARNTSRCTADASSHCAWNASSRSSTNSENAAAT